MRNVGCGAKGWRMLLETAFLCVCAGSVLAQPLAPGPEDSVPYELMRVGPVIERAFSSTPTPLSPEVKSFLLPGWGQFAQGRPAPGLAFMFLEALAVAGTIAFAIEGNRAYGRYRGAANAEDASRFRSDTLRADRRRNISIAGGLLVWSLNLFDVVRTTRQRRKG